MSHGLVAVRGGGDLATGIVFRLHRAGYDVVVLETDLPLMVRRTVSVGSAVFEGRVMIEDMEAVKISSPSDFRRGDGRIAVLVDPEGSSIAELAPDAVVDAIMAKCPTGTHVGMARAVVAIGPGFEAPRDVHAVVETKRGHTLGRVITHGSAIPNTGVPGTVGGYGIERLLRSPADGRVVPIKDIGDEVEAGETVASVNGEPVVSQISGVIRGMIHPTVETTRGMKIGDVDARASREHCFTISDKALSVAGGVLEFLTAAL